MAKKKTIPKSKLETAEPAIPFEDALEELREVVMRLENGNLTLSESLEHYEMGIKNLKTCHAALQHAQKRIELLVRLDDDGNLITRPFDDSATVQPTRQMTRQADLEDELDEEMGDEEDNDEILDIDDPNSLF